MITVSMGMVFRSAIYAMLSGAVFGALYSCGIRLMRFFSRVFRKCFRMKEKEILRSDFSKNAVDFAVVILMGISQLLANYVLLDGVFRVYTVILSLLVFLISKRIFLGAFKSQMD